MKTTKNYRKYVSTLVLSVCVIAVFSVYIGLHKESIGKLGNKYIMVVDAGHGGMDGGASGVSGVIEKNINLAISKKVYMLCGLFGQNCKLTRNEDISLNYDESRTVRENKSADLKARVQIVKNTENPVFISIHLNKFEEIRYKGAQTFYSANNTMSRILAENIQKNLVKFADNLNTRVAKQAENSIYIMKNTVCPSVIVECGFLSNPEEEQLLTEDNYQKKLAYAVFSGYTEFLISQKLNINGGSV